MASRLNSLWKAAVGAVRRLSADKWSFFVALLVVNALARPYAGLIHDAQLYAVQVLNRAEPGQYGDDLYLRYGSQDSYSTFSQLASPVAQVVGVRAAFFVFYLGSNAFFLFALQRFVQALVKRRTVAALALVYLAVAPIPFGGLEVFHVNENFLTPRLTAIALVLLGLERFLRGRSAVSLALIVAALALHPIMAFGGLLVWLYVNLAAKLTAKKTAALAVFCGLMAVGALVYMPLGTALFGHIDAAWQKPVHAANFYSLPAEWLFRDWLRIAIAFGVVAMARMQARRKVRVRSLLDGIMIVAALGMIVGAIAPYLPYALLFQGQAYRALWLLQLVQLPLGFWLIARWWARGPAQSRFRAFALIGSLAFVALTALQLLSAFFLLAIHRGRRIFAIEGRIWSTPMRTILAALAAAVVVVPLLLPVVLLWQQLHELVAPLEWAGTVAQLIGPLYAWLAAIGLLAVAYRMLGGGSRLRRASLAVCLVVQLAFFAVPQSPLYEWLGWHRRQDVVFVKQFLQERYGSSKRRPTVYWGVANVDEIWFSLNSKSYYSLPQTYGNMFNRGTAMEGQRRAATVARFEIQEYRRWLPLLSEWRRRLIRRVYASDFDSVDPTPQDLVRLCGDETVDVAVLRQAFDGLYSAGNGRWFIYECRRIEDAEKQQRLQTDNTRYRPRHGAGAACHTDNADDAAGADLLSCVSRQRRQPTTAPCPPAP
jgi:hypothetical protein